MITKLNEAKVAKAGDTMYGNLRFSHTTATIQRTTTDDCLYLEGGTGWNNGAHIVLKGKDKDSGVFILASHDGTNYNALMGKNDGTLTWNGKSIERVNSIGSNYIRYDNGLQICWGSTGATCNGTSGSFYYGVSDAYTFPVAFTSNPFVTATVRDDIAGLPFCAIDTVSSTSLKIEVFVTTSGKYVSATFIAIGFWK